MARVIKDAKAKQLYEATAKGDLKTVKTLLAAGANVNTAMIDNAMPIHLAAQEGHLEIVKVLLASGANVNAAMTDNTTPIYMAAEGGHLEIIKTLLTAGANVNAAVTGNVTPLYIAVQFGHLETVKTLLEAGANVNTAMTSNATPLYRAVQNGHLEIVKALLAAGANVNTATNDKFTPLYIAAQEGRLEIVKALLAAGANVNIATNDKFTPLYVAAQEGRLEIVKALLAAGAKVNAANARGVTPLYMAAQDGHLETVETLIAAGANVNTATNDKFTPLSIAAQEGHLETVKLLLAAGANVNSARSNNATPLYASAQNGHLEIVKALLEAGANVNTARNDNATPLYVSAQNGHLEIVKTLLAAGANVNTAMIDKATPLYIAAQEGHLEIVKTLLAAGANVNAAVIDNATPLYIAAQFGYLEIVKILLAAGANITDPNFKEKSILHWANEGRFAPAINELIKSYIPKWKGVTQSDLDKYDTIFLKEAEPGKRSPAEDNSLCPVCLKHVMRETGCLYMSHNCSKEQGFYHKQLYDKYKSATGIIVWCTSCGRICDNHKHYALGYADDPRPAFALRPVAFDPFESDCRKTNGGGGLPEKLARYQRLREVSLKLQDDVDMIDYITACTELVEEAWNAPLLLQKSATTKRKVATIETTSKWNIPKNVFPKNSIPVSNAPKHNYNSTGKFQPPVIYMPGDEGYAGNVIMMDDESPVIQFIHKPYKGGEFEDHIHGAGATATKVFISHDGLRSYLSGFGTHGGKCFDPDCKANLYPEEIAFAFTALKEKMGEDYITEQDKALLDGYTSWFKTKVTTQLGGKRGTRKLRQKGGDGSVLPFFQTAELAQCLTLPSKNTKTRKRRASARKSRKFRRSH